MSSKQLEEAFKSTIAKLEKAVPEDLFRRAIQDVYFCDPEPKGLPRAYLDVYFGDPGSKGLPGTYLHEKGGKYCLSYIGDRGEQTDSICSECIQDVIFTACYNFAATLAFNYTLASHINSRAELLKTKLAFLSLLGEDYYQSGKTRIEALLKQYPLSEE